MSYSTQPPGVCRSVSSLLSVMFAALPLVVRTAIAVEQEAEKPAKEGKSWSAGVDLTYSGKYVWRGINVVDGPVLQPTVWASYKNVAMSVWGNMDLTNTNGHARDFTERDYILDYSWKWWDMDLSVGTIYYEYPHTGAESTIEVYASAGLDAPLEPTLTVYRDIKEADGAYANLSIGHSFEDLWRLSAETSASLELGASMGYATSNFNRFYFGYDQSAFVEASVTAALPLQIGEHLTVTPSLNYTSLLDTDVRSGVSDDQNLWGGVSVTVAF